MSKYQDYADKPREFLALTGYTRTEFDALLPTLWRGLRLAGCGRLSARRDALQTEPHPACQSPTRPPETAVTAWGWLP